MTRRSLVDQHLTKRERPPAPPRPEGGWTDSLNIDASGSVADFQAVALGALERWLAAAKADGRHQGWLRRIAIMSNDIASTGFVAADELRVPEVVWGSFSPLPTFIRKQMTDDLAAEKVVGPRPAAVTIWLTDGVFNNGQGADNAPAEELDEALADYERHQRERPWLHVFPCALGASVRMDVLKKLSITHEVAQAPLAAIDAAIEAAAALVRMAASDARALDRTRSLPVEEILARQQRRQTGASGR